MNTKSKAPLKGAEGISIDSEKRTITITSLPWFQNSNEASANTTLIQSENKLISISKCSSNDFGSDLEIGSFRLLIVGKFSRSATFK